MFGYVPYHVHVLFCTLSHFSVPLEESSALMSIAPRTARPPATAEACETTPGDDDACTDVVLALEAEGASILAAASQHENRKHIRQPLPIHYEQQHAVTAFQENCGSHPDQESHPEHEPGQWPLPTHGLEPHPQPTPLTPHLASFVFSLSVLSPYL